MVKKLSIILLAALALISCGGGSSTGSKDGKKSEKVTEKQKDQAGQIIQYTNGIIDYLNETNSWLRSNDSSIENMLETGRGGRWNNMIHIIPNPSIGFKDKNLDTPPAAMDKEYQVYFKETIAEYRETFKGMQENCEKLVKYIRNQDYKDDDYAKGKELSDKISEALDYIYETKSDLYDTIDEATYDAEYIILSDHPLRDPIFTMKDEMANFQNLYSIFYLYNEKETTVEQADSAYQAVFADVEKNKELYAEVLEEQGEKDSYDAFYETCDDALASYRFSLRTYVKAGREIPSSELRTFTSNYNRLVSRYNSFNN